MTLKEELEILRGEPIQVFDGDPMEIPCIETSDAEKLCKHPVVSVHMITYNHEPYIRQAIEGVMMQQTDFEFELIIGEDCSQDKTREICFEYQKKYPDKIRVLWWHENVTKFGGNGRRVTARCRGEFIALCEGDDYWIDPLKLQKQVDIMRKHPNVGLCFAQANVMRGGIQSLWKGECFPQGYIQGREFVLWHGFGKKFNQKRLGQESFIMTATVLLRRSILELARHRYEIFKWRLLLGDTTIWLGCASLSDVYFLKEAVAVYRRHANGAMAIGGSRITRDGLIVRMFYGVKALMLSLDEVVDYLRNLYALSIFSWLLEMERVKQKEVLETIKRASRLKEVLRSYRALPVRFLLWMGWTNPLLRLWAYRFWLYMPRMHEKCLTFHKLYILK